MLCNKIDQYNQAIMQRIACTLITVILIIGGFSDLVYSQVLFDNSPDYYFDRQSYRKDHRPELFLLPAQPDDKFAENSMRLVSSLQVSNNIPENVLYIQLLMKSRRWSLYTEPWVVNEYYGTDIIGADFTRLGLKGRYVQSYLKYGGENFKFKLGRFRQRWGQSYSNSLVFSLHALPFDQASLDFSLGQWKFDMFGGSFSSELTNDSTKINRHVAGHRIRRSLFDDRLQLEAGEVIVYTGGNRNWDMQYLSPFSLYYIDMFDPTNYLSDDNNLGDNENALMYFTARWVHTPSLSAYCEFLLDDYQLHDTGVQDKLGFIIGIDGSSVIKSIPVSYETEFYRIDSWSYLNNGQLTNFENLGHTAGHPFGPDNQGFHFQADAWLIEKLRIELDYTYLEKGVNTLLSLPGSENNQNTVRDPFPRPPVNYYNLARISLSWWMKYGRVEVGWSNIPFANQIAYDGNPEIKGSLYLKLQGYYTFHGF